MPRGGAAARGGAGLRVESARFARAESGFMQTALAESIKSSPPAPRPMRSCAAACTAASACRPVRPISCSATNSTVPRGRIYLLKQLLEGEPVSARTQLHLDRCLGCRACESACPSGVRYGRLLDLGRPLDRGARPRARPLAAARSATCCARSCRTPAAPGRCCAPPPLARPLLPQSLRRQLPRLPPARAGRRARVAGAAARAARGAARGLRAADARRGDQSGRRPRARSPRDLGAAGARRGLLRGRQPTTSGAEADTRRQLRSNIDALWGARGGGGRGDHRDLERLHRDARRVRPPAAGRAALRAACRARRAHSPAT